MCWQAVVRGHIRYYGVPLNQNRCTYFGSKWDGSGIEPSRRSQDACVLLGSHAASHHSLAAWSPVCHPCPPRRMEGGRAPIATESRSQLDERFRELGPATRYAAPVRGWIKAIREALGMSTAQLAKRLGIKQPSLVALEQSEAKGSIELATLRRVAEALDCTLVFALVPDKPLESTVRGRARAFLSAAPGAGRTLDVAGGPKGDREKRRSAAR